MGVLNYMCFFKWLEGKVLHTTFILTNLWFSIYYIFGLSSCLSSSMTNPFGNPPPSLCLVYCFIGGSLHILSPVVCLGLFWQLLNWIPLKITSFRHFKTSFSQVRGRILLRSEQLARVAEQRLVGCALSKPCSFALELESTGVTIHSLERMKTPLSGQFLFLFSICISLSKSIILWWGRGI